MRRVGQQPPALVERLEDKLELAEVELAEGALEVAHPAVHQFRGPGAGARGEVVALDEGDREAARRRVQRDASARRAAADDEDVEDRRGGRGLRLLSGPGPEVAEGVLARGEPVGEGDAGDLGVFSWGAEGAGRRKKRVRSRGSRSKARGHSFSVSSGGAPKRRNLAFLLLLILKVTCLGLSGLKQLAVIALEERKEREW